MKSAYNYTAVETHKQKLYIPLYRDRTEWLGDGTRDAGRSVVCTDPHRYPCVSSVRILGDPVVDRDRCGTGDRRCDVPDRDRPGEPQEQADHVLLSGCEELSHPV